MAPVVRKVELPASMAQAEGARPADQARAVEKPAENSKEIDTAKAADPSKLADKTKIADKSTVAEKAKVTDKTKAADKTKIAEKAKAAEPPPPGWRVQLGAFGSKTQADTSWGEIAKKQKAAIGKSKPIYDPGRGIVKLQIGPYKTRAEAKDACAKLAFAGQACFVTEG